MRTGNYDEQHATITSDRQRGHGIQPCLFHWRRMMGGIAIYQQLTLLSPRPTWKSWPISAALGIGGNGETGFNCRVRKGDNLSPRELQGRYTIALERIGGADAGDRQKPIYQRDSRMTEQQAIEQAAKALSALWKLSRDKA
jgi:hypothetical protein